MFEGLIWKKGQSLKLAPKLYILVCNFILTKIQTADDNIMMEKRDKWDSDYFSETVLNVLNGDM